jgi:site-specific DNA-methyltransferase (adenine-specific)
MNALINRVTQGNCIDLLSQLEDDSIDLVITSPPYFNQRFYDNPDEIGRETNLDDYLGNLITVFKECLRVIKPTGSVVFNLGDKYQDGSLLLVPFQFALRARNVPKSTLINNVTWVKSNPTPRQFQKRMVSSTEPFFHFVKDKKYHYDPSYYDQNEVKPVGKNVGQKYFDLIETSGLSHEEKANAKNALSQTIEDVLSGSIAGFRMKIRGIHSLPFGGQPGGRLNQINNQGYTIIKIHGRKMHKDVIETAVGSCAGGKHPAIYPQEIVERFIRITTPENGIVLDPFMGSGTTGLAALNCDRKFIGFELCQNYVTEANARISQETIYV